MAKTKKISSKKQEGCSLCSYSPTIYLDFAGVDQLEGLKVGETVRVVVKGKIQGITQREGYEDKEETQASLTLKDFEAKIVTDENQFEDLMEDGDE